MVSDDFNSSGNVSNWELGRIFVRDGKFDDAHRCFLAEVTHSGSANTLVYNDHGHLLNMMGRYEDAIVKFDSYLSSHDDFPSSWFGKGISFIGLNRLDDALYCFAKARGKRDGHAAAWYYSAIIYANPFYPDYNISSAKEYYEKYLNSREDYINNLDNFNEPFDGLSLEEVHDYYKVSDFFSRIEQFLESGNVDVFYNVLKDYGVLYCSEDDLDKLFDIFRLFDDDDVSLDDRIDEFNGNKSIEVKFESAGYEEYLIGDLSSRFGGLSIEDKKVLVELMDYFKGFRLSLTDINDLIREYVFEGEMSIDSFNENREYIVNTRIEENESIITKPFKENLNNEIEENEQLRSKYVKLKNKCESLSKENKDLLQKFQNKKSRDKKLSNQPNSIAEYNKLIKDMSSSIENLCTELFNQMESCLSEDYKDASSKNRLSGFMNMDYKKDLNDLKVLKILEEIDSGILDEDYQKVLKILEEDGEDDFHIVLRKLEEIAPGISDEEYKKDLENLVNAPNISKEVLQEVLEVLEDEYDISNDVFNTFELAFKNFKDGNFKISLDLFRDTNLKGAFLSDELQKYREFLEITSLSREGEVEEAYKIIKSKINMEKKKGKICILVDNDLKIEKNPILWFNFGNICFDYANLQSFKDDSNEAYELAYSCYDCAMESFKLNIFKFSSKEKKEFVRNIRWMNDSRKIYEHLKNIKKFKKGAVITKKLSDLNKLQGQIFHDLEEIKNPKQK